MSEFQIIITFKISQFIIDCLSLYIMIINRSNLKCFIKNKTLFEFFLINILISIASSFYFYNNVTLNIILSILCFSFSLIIFMVNSEKVMHFKY